VPVVGKRAFVYATLSGFGETGPWQGYRSYGRHLGELSGLSALTGTARAAPIEMAIPFSDPLGGSFGAAAIANFWRDAKASQSAIHLDFSQLEILVAGLAGALLHGRPTGNRSESRTAGSGVYACSQASTWIALNLTSRSEVRQLRALLCTGTARTLQPQRLERDLAGWAATRTAAEAAHILRSFDFDCTEVLSPAELLNDPALRGADFWGRVGQAPEFWHTNAPWATGGVRPVLDRAAPRLGEHTNMVLEQILGYSSHRIEVLRNSGCLT